MKFGIIVTTNDPKTAWNTLRLGNEALSAGNEVSLFLLGSSGGWLTTAISQRTAMTVTYEKLKRRHIW